MTEFRRIGVLGGGESLDFDNKNTESWIVENVSAGGFGAVVPQLVSLLASDNKQLVDRFVTPYTEDVTGKHITAWCSSEPEVGSDGSNYEDPSIHHHTGARARPSQKGAPDGRCTSIERRRAGRQHRHPVRG